MDKIKQIIEEIESIKQDYIVIAIDGRCASGKTTLAEKLAQYFHANVFHMDDYFLRKEQRTKERLSEIGGNVDRERFIEEIASKLHSDEDIVFAPFDCQTMSVKEKRIVKQTHVTIVEGSYAMHHSLRKYYDYMIYLTIDPNMQRKRIYERNPGRYEDFINRWIPLEETYFSSCRFERICNICIKAEEW